MAKKDNKFLLPDELGWECNDELRDYFYKWLKHLAYQQLNYDGVSLDVGVAQLMDNWYAIIKKYQKKQTKLQKNG